ncbi:hypothetical protein GCM10027062_06200 [Nocardioides hungaricus]
MTWTDDELGTLLRDTFASRESLADPDVARAIVAGVPPGPRRAWPAYAAAAAVAVLATVLAVTVVGGDPAPPVAGPTPSPPASPAPTYRLNRLAAAAESEQILASLPVPERSTRLRGEPEGWPADSGLTVGPSDGTLTRTAWWTVPSTADVVEAYLLSHRPPGTRRDGGVGSVGPEEVRYVDYVQDPPGDAAAFTGIDMVVQWLEVGGRTLVRADTFTAARAVRTAESYVDGPVTAVDIERVVADPAGNRRVAPVRLARPDDSGAIDLLVDTVNGLYASTRPAPAGLCLFPGDPRPSITLTFDTADATVTMSVETSCWGQVEIRRDGVPVGPTLDPGDLSDVVDRLVRDR